MPRGYSQLDKSQLDKSQLDKWGYSQLDKSDIQRWISIGQGDDLGTLVWHLSNKTRWLPE